MRVAVTFRTPQRSADILVEADPSTTLAEVFGGRRPAGQWFVDGRAVPGSASLASAGLRDGAVVSTRPQHPAVPTATPGTMALLVASGPAAGASATVSGHAFTIGRAAPLQLGDNEMSGRHLQARVDRGSVMVADAGSSNGTVVAGERLRRRTSAGPR